MFWLIVFLIGFTALHLGFLVQTQVAIVSAAMLTVVLWLIWKLKWVILGIIGLEELFGGKGDSA